VFNFVYKNILGILIILLSLSAYLWLYRHVYFDPYDIDYNIDLYVHSQWNIKDAVRSIGDDGLYQAAAARMLQTGNPYEFNAEAPPIGKYLIALSIMVFHSPYTIYIAIFVITGLLFLYLLNLVELSTPKIVLGMLLFALEPMIAAQMGATMLDLPQLMFLLVHVIGMYWLVKADYKVQNILAILTAGVGFGLFFATKFGLLGVAIILADAYVFWRLRAFYTAAIVGVIGIAVYVLSALPYFLAGNSIVDYLRVQGYMLAFYERSDIRFVVGGGLLTLVAPFFVGWWGDPLQYVREWNLLYPLSLVALFFGWKHYKTLMILKYEEPNRDLYYKHMLIMVSALAVLLAIIPFWPRYLVLYLPFAIILILTQLPWTEINYWGIRVMRKKMIWYGVLVGLFLVYTVPFLTWYHRAGPTNVARAVERYIEVGIYQDMYQTILNRADTKMERDEFWRHHLAKEEQMEVERKEATLEVGQVWPWENTATGELTIVYTTSIGEFTRNTGVELVRDSNRWYLKWYWGMLIDGYQPNQRIVLEKELAQGGEISSGGKVVSKYGEWPMIRVLPSRINRDEEWAMAQTISEVTGIHPTLVQTKYTANHPYDWYADIGFAQLGYNENAFQRLEENPAVKIEQRWARSFDSDFVWNDKKEALEKIIRERAEEITPRSGGRLYQKLRNGQEIVILETDPQDAQNITVSL
jgi:hypothetical protein